MGISGTLIEEPENGDYRVFIAGKHMLTKRIINKEGQNFLPWFTSMPLLHIANWLPWKSKLLKMGLPTGDFKMRVDPTLRMVVFDYGNGVIDYLKKMKGKKNVWSGVLCKNEKKILRFILEKIND